MYKSQIFTCKKLKQNCLHQNATTNKKNMMFLVYRNHTIEKHKGPNRRMAKAYEHTIPHQKIKMAAKHWKLVNQFLVNFTSNQIKA